MCSAPPHFFLLLIVYSTLAIKKDPNRPLFLPRSKKSRLLSWPSGSASFIGSSEGGCQQGTGLWRSSCARQETGRDLSSISISSSTCWLSVEELGRINQQLQISATNEWHHCFRRPTRLSGIQSRTFRNIVSYFWCSGLQTHYKSVTIDDWSLTEGPVMARQPGYTVSVLFLILFGAAGSITSRLEQPVIWPNFQNWENAWKRFWVCGQRSFPSSRFLRLQSKNSFARCDESGKSIYLGPKKAPLCICAHYYQSFSLKPK